MAPVRTQLLDLSQAPSNVQNPGSPPGQPPTRAPSQLPVQPPEHPRPTAPAWPGPRPAPPSPIPPVDPSAPSSDDRTTAVLAYVGALLMPVLVPLLIFATSDKKPFVRAVAAQAVAAQLGTAALGMVLPLISIVTVLALSLSGNAQGLVGIVATLPVLFMVLVLALGVYSVLKGAMWAHRGEVWRVPLIGGLAARLTGTHA